MKITKAIVARYHAHIDAGHDGNPYSFLFISGGMMNIDELFDVLPISHYHSLELHFATQYVGEEVLVYVSWDSINLSRVHHQRVSAGFNRCQEGRHIVLAKSN